MAAWNKYLAVQLNQMLLGYQIAREVQKGTYAIRCTVYGRLRPLIGVPHVDVYVDGGAQVGDVLRKFFNYYPQVRPEALDRVWRSQDATDGLWIDVKPSYVPRYGWRLLLNGRELLYNNGGLVAPIRTADQIAIFPPGR